MIPCRLTARLLSPARQRARLTILLHHRVLPTPDPLQSGALTASDFSVRMEVLKSCFQVLPLEEALARLRTDSLPARAACVTFDDGYADNLTVAVPILRDKGLHATFFVASDYLDGGRMFNDTLTEAVRLAADGRHDLSEIGLGTHHIDSAATRRRLLDFLIDQVKYLSPAERTEKTERIARRFCEHAPLPTNLMMTTEQLRALRDAGMGIGAHTASHPILARQSDKEAMQDIERGKRRLETLLHRQVRLFAYPNGRPGLDYRTVHVEMVRELGFLGAVSTSRGVATRKTDLFQLPRFSPWSRQPTRAAVQLLRNLTQQQPEPPLL